MPLPYPATPPSDFGFGTAYERVAIYELISRWISEWNFKGKTGLEGFSDGFTGLPGLHLLPLAKAGGFVTVVCGNESQAETVRRIYQSLGLESQLETLITQTPADLSGRHFDLGFLFSPFPYVENWQEFLDSIAHLISERLIIAVANPNSYGALFRRGMKALRPIGRIDLFDHPTTSISDMRKILVGYGTITVEDYFDCPWWPDLFVEAGDSVASWLMSQIPLLGRFASKPIPSASSASPAEQYRYGETCFPYFKENSPELSALRQKIARHPTFDHHPAGFFKEFFAHHRIFVVDRMSSL